MFRDFFDALWSQVRKTARLINCASQITLLRCRAFFWGAAQGDQLRGRYSTIFGGNSAKLGSKNHCAALQSDFFRGRTGRSVFRTFFDALRGKVR